jgi:protein ImuA
MYKQYLVSTARADSADQAAILPALIPPALIHPALWRAHQLGRTQGAVWPSQFAALDAQLPGGGWPAGVLTELLLPHAGVGELRLLAPLLATLQAQQRSVMWFDPPAAPCPWALAALGLDVQQLVVVQSRAALQNQARGRVFNTFKPFNASTTQPARKLLPAADVLWALEQALKSGHLGAVLAWLPARLPADALRRLQLAAQAHDGPAFLLRDASMRTQPSAAPLRLLLGSAGPDVLRVTVLKRRGPPLAQAITLALPAVLSAPALARALRVRDVPQPVLVSVVASGMSPQPLRVETVA